MFSRTGLQWTRDIGSQVWRALRLIALPRYSVTLIHCQACQFFLSPAIRQRSDQRPETHSVLFRTVTRLHGMDDVTPSALGFGYLLFTLVWPDWTYFWVFVFKATEKTFPISSNWKENAGTETGISDCQSISDGYIALPASIKKKRKVLPLDYQARSPLLEIPIIKGSIYIWDRVFKGFADNMITIKVNKTKWTGLLGWTFALTL